MKAEKLVIGHSIKKKANDLNSLSVLCSSIQFTRALVLLPEWAVEVSEDSPYKLFFLIFLQILNSAVTIRSSYKSYSLKQ